jgi:MFS family permease
MTLASSRREGLSAGSGVVVALLAIVVFLNFFDRSNLSIAAPLLKDELHLSASQLGLLLSSFFWSYTLCQIPAGWIVDRYGANWVLAAGFFVWSCATLVTGLLHEFAALLAIRLILGIGESVAYPSCWSILARHFPEQRRGFGSAIVQAGQASGPALATFAGGMLMERFGWQPFFIVLGLTSLLWLVPWLRWMPKGQFTRTAQANRTYAGTLEVLRQRSAWGTCVGNFCVNWLLYLLLTWLPFYLVHERHFSLSTTAKIGGAAFLLKATSSITSGWLAHTWIARGASPTLVRKSFLCAGLIVSSLLFLISAGISASTPSLILLLAASACFGLSSPHGPAIIQTLAGQQLAGTWTGLVLFVANFAGILAPVATGFVVDRTGHFFWAFALAAAFAGVGVASYLWVVGTIKQVVWVGQAQPQSTG